MTADALTGVTGHQYGLHSYARAREDAARAVTRERSGETTGKGRIPEHQDGRDTRTGRFLPGHRFWASRCSSGAAPRFADAETLWKACVKYFESVDEHPLYKMQLVTYRGRTTQVPLARMRAMTKGDLCRFLSIQRSTWNGWKRDRPDLALTIERVESVIWVWNFNGAAAGLLDAGMVIRQLGLGRRAEHGR